MKTYNYTIKRQYIAENSSDYIPAINRPNAIADYIRDNIEEFYQSDQEHFYIFCLDTKNRLKGFSLITQGLLDRSHVHPREVFKPAIISSASKIIIAHNHPSGAVESSKQDRDCTENLIESGKILGIPVVDSLIVGESHGAFVWASLRQNQEVEFNLKA